MTMYRLNGVPANVRALPILQSASGSIASFNTDLTDDFVEVKCQIIAQQASGTPTQDSPLSITGFSQADIINGIPTILLAGCNVNSSGKITSQERYNLVYFPCVQGEKYLLNTNEPSLVYAFFENVPVLNATSYDNARYIDTDMSSDTITAPITGYFVFRYDATSSDYGYVGTRVIVSFGQTVYGGEIDVTTGKLRVTHRLLDLGSFTYTYSASDKWFYNGAIISSLVKKPETNDDVADIISEMYPACSRNALSGDDTLEGIAVNRLGTLQIRNLSYTDPEVFKTAMSGVKCVYELATPMEIQCDSIAIPTLNGTNNIFVDTGDTEVKFWMSINKYIGQ